MKSDRNNMSSFCTNESSERYERESYNSSEFVQERPGVRPSIRTRTALAPELNLTENKKPIHFFNSNVRSAVSYLAVYVRY